MLRQISLIGLLGGALPSAAAAEPADSAPTAATAPTAPTAPPSAPTELELDRQHAQPIKRPARVPLLLAESAAVLIPPMIYYWSNTSLQREDWELRWDWESWITKLTSLRALALDTGYWDANAIRHPIAGALAFQVARANGYGAATSTVIDLLSAASWEYVVEFKERVSVNDLVTNSLAGILLGEPLFQLGQMADRRDASWARSALGWVVSPVHRLHAAAGYSSWRAPVSAWSRFDFSAGGRLVDQGARPYSEATLELDLELVRERRYGAEGQGAVWLRSGAWSHVQAEVRLAADGASRVWLRSATHYAGRYWRALAPGGDVEDAPGEGGAGVVGADQFLGVAGGMDYESRRVGDEWDHALVFNVAGPRLALGSWRGGRRWFWEVGAYADVAMVRAHVFGPVSPFAPVPQNSVLQVRGYYYATGASLMSRLRLVAPPWYADVDARAHALWSIDGFDRVELDGADGDPHDVTDQRVAVRAALGVGPWWSDVRFELALDTSLRRGAWDGLERETAEIDAGVNVVVGF
ncbi:MAG: DUF3943 domain-containing protein [Myxococcales bacterium]|nr:DUF3943 domain-containing protein [Myxococcales bacterium]